MTIAWVHDGVNAHSIRRYDWHGLVTHCGKVIEHDGRTSRQKLHTWSVPCVTCAARRAANEHQEAK